MSLVSSSVHRTVEPQVLSAASLVASWRDTFGGLRGRHVAVRWVDGGSERDVVEVIDCALREGMHVSVSADDGLAVDDSQWQACDDLAVCWGGRLVHGEPQGADLDVVVGWAEPAR